jgi:hypothetical protein
MDKYPYSRELFELACAACEGRLDADSMASLEGLLSESDEACALWLKYMQLDADLRVLVATSLAERQALGNLTATAGLPMPVVPTATPPTSPWFYVLMSGLVVAAVSMVVAVSAVFWSHSRPADHPVAQSKEAVKSMVKGEPGDAPATAPPNDLIRLVRPPQQVAALFSASGDAVWSEGASYQVGQLLPQGTRLELLAGSAQISMTSGADVVLQSPCSVILMDDRLVQLLTGKLTVQVAAWATGFVVEARGLKITDLGTRFAVSAESRGATEAHVLDGSVLAKPLQPGREHEEPLLLRSGEAIRVNVAKGEVDRFAAERNRFVDKFHNVRPYRTLELPNTGKGFVIGDEDSNWHITAGPKSIGPWPQPAFVTLPNVRYLDNAPEKSQWISVKGGARRSAPRNTVFTFDTTFDLTGFDPATVSVVAQILADNGVKAMRLNGKPVSIEPWVDNIIGQKFQTFHVVEFRKGFIQGINRIEIDVFNGISVGYRSSNPMALRVEWQAFGCIQRD